MCSIQVFSSLYVNVIRRKLTIFFFVLECSLQGITYVLVALYVEKKTIFAVIYAVVHMKGD